MSFGETQTQSSSAAPAQPEIGITTVVKDLANAVVENQSISSNIKAALGISEPKPLQGESVAGSASLVSVIRGITSQVYSNNQNLIDVLRHINS